MKNRLMGPIFWVVVFVVSAVGLAAQQQGAAGAKTIPRTADGKPDLSGVWSSSSGGGGSKPVPMQLTAWGIGKFNWNKLPKGDGARPDQDPILHCYRPGLVRLGPPLQIPGPPYTDKDPGVLDAIQIVYAPRKVIVLYQYNHEMRQIFTDGREHPKDLVAGEVDLLTWNGHSIGRWDGDTFVVDTIGLFEEGWLDNLGHEHSTKLHVVERIQRVDHDTLQIERTLTDTIALAKPYTTRAVLKLMPPDVEFQESVICNQYWVRQLGYGFEGLLQITNHPWSGPDRSVEGPNDYNLEELLNHGWESSNPESP